MFKSKSVTSNESSGNFSHVSKLYAPLDKEIYVNLSHPVK